MVNLGKVATLPPRAFPNVEQVIERLQEECREVKAAAKSLFETGGNLGV